MYVYDVNSKNLQKRSLTEVVVVCLSGRLNNFFVFCSDIYKKNWICFTWRKILVWVTVTYDVDMITSIWCGATSRWHNIFWKKLIRWRICCEHEDWRRISEETSRFVQVFFTQINVTCKAFDPCSFQLNYSLQILYVWPTQIEQSSF